MRYYRRKKRVKRTWAIAIALAICFILMTIRNIYMQAYRARQFLLEEQLVETDPNMHTYNWDNLTWSNGFPSYEDDTYTSEIGIDVSSHQKSIDWAAVKNSGVKFAMIQVGYRGYETGALMDDAYFEENIQGAIENGIDVGVYFFSQAVSAEEARAEADFVLERVKKYKLQLPIVFDLEEVSNATDRVENTTSEERTQAAVTFMNHIKNAGYQAMVYSSSQLFETVFDINYLHDYDFWVADYSSVPNFSYHFSIWQYTDAGTVDGISTNVDMNIMFVKK
ncbi:MAG: hypothetical protein HXL58_01435 [Solobacterium sp.]|nr:hypothetical protein [Solobacterium sp.]